jgi:hypothetical protein
MAKMANSLVSCSGCKRKLAVSDIHGLDIQREQLQYKTIEMIIAPRQPHWNVGSKSHPSSLSPILSSQNPSINFCTCQVTLLNFMITVVGLQALHSRSVVALVAQNLSDRHISDYHRKAFDTRILMMTALVLWNMAGL